MKVIAAAATKTAIEALFTSIVTDTGKNAAASITSVRRVSNQPPGCPLWYFFDVEEFDLAGPLRRYLVAFREDEETTALVGMAKAVPDGFIQFNPLPSDDGTGARSVRQVARIIGFDSECAS